MARTEVRGGQILDQTVKLDTPNQDVTGVLPVANGGTGAATQNANNVLLGNGTGALQNVAPGASGNLLSSNGTTWASAAPASNYQGNIFQSLSATQSDIVLTASTNFLVGENLEIGASYSLEIPATSSLEITVYGNIVNNSITAQKLATNAITLGYAQIISNYAHNATISAVTGLSVDVNIPPGGRRIKITGFVQSLTSDFVGVSSQTLSIWDGAVGTGTQLSTSQNAIPSAGAGAGVMVMAVVSPTAGPKTYNIGVASSGGNLTLSAGATFPAFILVEVI